MNSDGSLDSRRIPIWGEQHLASCFCAYQGHSALVLPWSGAAADETLDEATRDEPPTVNHDEKYEFER
jgi:hypothetical protein